MVHATKVNGKIIWHMVVESFITIMAISSTASGLKTKLMATASTTRQKGRNMKATGSTISKMVKGKRLGRKAHSMRECSVKDRNVETVNTFGQMVVSTRDNGKTTKYMVKVSMYGTIKNMWVNGSITQWMVKEY